MVVDVETSGLAASSDRVLSLAALALREDGSIERELVTLLNPGCDPGPVHIHKLTPQRLAGAPTFPDIADELAELLEGRTLVAHNASFDYSFINAEFIRAGRTAPTRQRLCTLALSRRLEIDVPNHQLATLAKHWQVDQRNAHDAHDDALVLTEVFTRSAALADLLRLPLPVVACTGRQTVYEEQFTRVPTDWVNPGRLQAETGLVQGMRVVVSGSTVVPRMALSRRLSAAGLDVMNSVSRLTGVVVCNDEGSGTSKVARAQAEGIPVITEAQLEMLLVAVAPGTLKGAPVVRAPEPPEAAAPRKPWHGRRVLIVGGSHGDAVLMRSRIVQLGAKPSVNLTAGVTDVLVLDGGDRDPRMERVGARGLTLHAPADLDQMLDPEPRTEPHWVAPQLARGQVVDLAAGTTALTLNAAWRADAGFEVDVAAFLLGPDERVCGDEDFIFFNQPVGADGAVELSLDGGSEQGLRADLGQLGLEHDRILITAAIGGGRTFGELGPISVTVDGAEGTVVSFVLDAGTTERTMELAAIYRRGQGWRLRAIGQGYENDLAALAGGLGVSVE